MRTQWLFNWDITSMNRAELENISAKKMEVLTSFPPTLRPLRSPKLHTCCIRCRERTKECNVLDIYLKPLDVSEKQRVKRKLGNTVQAFWNCHFLANDSDAGQLRDCKERAKRGRNKVENMEKVANGLSMRFETLISKFWKGARVWTYEKSL